MTSYRGQGRGVGQAQQVYNQPRRPRQMPQDYLKDGYFVKDAVLKDRLILDDPKFIVGQLTDPNLLGKPLEYSQLRKFFSFVRQMEYRLRGSEQWENVRQDILRLPVYAADAVNRQVAPQVWCDIMKENAKWATGNTDSFLKGLLLHFESIVAFFPRKGQR